MTIHQKDDQFMTLNLSALHSCISNVQYMMISMWNILLNKSKIRQPLYGHFVSIKSPSRLNQRQNKELPSCQQGPNFLSRVLDFFKIQINSAQGFKLALVLGLGP